MFYVDNDKDNSEIDDVVGIEMNRRELFWKADWGNVNAWEWIAGFRGSTPRAPSHASQSKTRPGPLMKGLFSIGIQE